MKINKNKNKSGITKLKMTGFEKILNNFKHDNRSESELFMLRAIDITDLVKYKEEKMKSNPDLTYFHLFAMAMAKTIYNRPLLNSFLIGGKKYQRHDVTLSYVAKIKFEDSSKENLTVIKVEENDTLNTLSKKFVDSVKLVRKDQKNSTDNFVKSVDHFPKWLISLIGWGARKLDRYGLMPKSIIDNDIYHSSIIISNLGSIHCDVIYHNLSNWGTNSIICTIGEIREEPKVINGKIVIRKICEFGVTLDERLADGYYFAKSLNLFKHIITNPKLLDDKASTKIDINYIR